jgi:methionyl-tRNA formyltransferase
MADKLRIVFYGTPDFAVESLDAILKANFDVLAVVTSPDRKSGRGMKVQHSAVKQFAIEHNLPVLQPTNLKSEEFADQLKKLNPNIQVVIAFRMMPEKVWNFPELGTINLHASLLPAYRGAAPINWAIINGEKETGVSTFRLKHEIDTGNLLKQEKVDILPNDDVGVLHDRLMHVGANLMVETLIEIENGTAVETEQLKSGEDKHAPKIFKDDCQINWEKSSYEILNLIRGLSPYPVARTSMEGKVLKIFKASTLDNVPMKDSGTIESDNETYIHVYAADACLNLEVIQLEGEKKMNVDEFLRGYDISAVKSLLKTS